MSPSEFYLWCPRHQGEELHSQYLYPHLKCSLSEEKSKSVPPNHRFSRALLHRARLQVRFIPFTLFYILFLLSSSHFSCYVVLLWKGMKRYFNIYISSPKKTKQKKQPSVKRRGMLVSNSCKSKVTPKPSWISSLSGIFKNSKGCTFSGTIALAVLLSRKVFSSAEFG